MPYKLNPITGKFDYFEPVGDITVTEESIQFIDNFDDNSVFWAWRQRPGNGSISESGDTITLSIANGIDGRGIRQSKRYDPRIFTSLISSPAIVEAKLNSFTVNDNCSAGIFIALVAGYSYAATYILARERDDVAAYNGLAAWCNGANLATNSVTTLPIYLRIKVAIFCSYESARIVAEYSTDGNTWTALTSNNIDMSDSSFGQVGAGLFAENNIALAGYNAIEAPFDYFRMYRVFGP